MDCIVHGVTKSWTRLSNSHVHSLVTGEKTLLKKKKAAGELSWRFRGKESACQGDKGSIPGWRKSPGERNGNHSSILA